MNCLICLIALAAAAAPQSDAAQPTGVQAFVERVESYVVLHRSVEKTLAPEEPFIDPSTMLAASDALRMSLRGARAGAREGELFGPVAGDFRLRIRRTLRAHAIEARDLIAEMVEDTEGTPPRVMVNEQFAWLHGNVMLTCVLEALPPLPPELEYRFVGADLVLIDVHADMVVDILRDVLPAAPAR